MNEEKTGLCFLQMVGSPPPGADAWMRIGPYDRRSKAVIDVTPGTASILSRSLNFAGVVMVSDTLIKNNWFRRVWAAMRGARVVRHFRQDDYQ